MGLSRVKSRLQQLQEEAERAKKEPVSPLEEASRIPSKTYNIDPGSTKPVGGALSTILKRVREAGELLPGVAGMYLKGTATPENRQERMEKAAAIAAIKEIPLGYGPNLDPSFKPEGTAEQAAGIAGTVAGSLPAFAALGAGAKAAGLKGLLKESAIGAGYGALSKTEPDESRLKNIALNAVLFPAFTLAGRGISKAGGKLADIVRGGRAPSDEAASKIQREWLARGQAEGVIPTDKALSERPDILGNVGKRLRDLSRKVESGLLGEDVAYSKAVNAFKKASGVAPEEGKGIGRRIVEAVEGKPLAPGEEITEADVIRRTLFESASTADRLVPDLGKKTVVSIRTKDLMVGPEKDLLAGVTAKVDPTKEERLLVGKYLAGVIDDIPAKLAGIAETAKKSLDNFWKEASSSGVLEKLPDGTKVPIRYRENYFPLVLSDAGKKALRKEGDFVKALLEKNPGLSREQAVLQRKAMLDNLAATNGNLERARTLDIKQLPDEWINWDYGEVLPNYYDKAGMRIAQTKEFGPNDEWFTESLAKVTEGAPQRRRLAENFYDEVYGRGVVERPLELENTLLRTLRNTQVVLKLGAGFIRQPSQIVNIAMQTAETGGMSWKDVVKAFSKDAIALGHKINATDRAAAADLFGGDSKMATKYLKFTMFTWFDDLIRRMAAKRGASHVEAIIEGLAKDPANKRLRTEAERLYLNPDDLIANPSDITHRLKGAWAINKASNFLPEKVFLPPGMTSEVWQTILQFKSYSMRQGHELWEYGIKQGLEHNNWKPLKTFTKTLAALGVPIVVAYSLMTGREPPKSVGEAAWDIGTFGGPGYGITGDLEAAKFGKGGLAAALGGPTISDVSSLAYSGARSIKKGDLTPLVSDVAQRVTKPIPFLGPRISRKIKDIFAEQQKAETKARRKLQKQKKKLEE